MYDITYYIEEKQYKINGIINLNDKIEKIKIIYPEVIITGVRVY